MTKIINLSIFLFLSACEFRPPSYNFTYDYETTKCIYPVSQIHTYGVKNTITSCVYNNKRNVKEENTYNLDNLTHLKQITYEYKKTFYIKIVYDYVNGNPDNFYIQGKYYIER